jgi:hypothetical protein
MTSTFVKYESSVSVLAGTTKNYCVCSSCWQRSIALRMPVRLSASTPASLNGCGGRWWDVSRSALNLMEDIVAYFLKARNRHCWVMARTHAAEERVTYAVTSCNNRRSVASSVLCGSAPSSLLCNCAAVNQHTTIEEVAFSVGPHRGYLTRISRS